MRRKSIAKFWLEMDRSTKQNVFKLAYDNLKIWSPRMFCIEERQICKEILMQIYKSNKVYKTKAMRKDRQKK